MRVRLLTIMAGPSGSYSAGETPDLPEAQARELIAGGYAVPLHEGPVGTAAMAAPEQAVTRRGRPPGR